MHDVHGDSCTVSSTLHHMVEEMKVLFAVAGCYSSRINLIKMIQSGV